MKQELEKEIQKSLFVHKMLPLHRERSLEATFAGKEVLERKSLFPGAEGNVSSEFRFSAPLRGHQWPEGAAPDGDYSNFGRASLEFDIGGADWSGYNRLAFRVKPEIPGAWYVHIHVELQNEGENKVPDLYGREGTSYIELNNGVWNQCWWEFPSLPRDCVTKLRFFVLRNGQDTAMGETLTYAIREIALERVKAPEKEYGWDCEPEKILVSRGGYLLRGRKTAVTGYTSGEFLLCGKQGGIVFRGPIEKVENEKGCFGILDFSSVQEEGEYYLQVKGTKSSVFSIEEDMLEETVWKSLNFLYGERCGMPVEGKHGACHADILAEHGGVSVSYAGGWHDAGDVSQQTVQTGEVVAALLETAKVYEDKSPLLAARLEEEARWGMELVLRTRFGDGYRVTSAGCTRWTNGKIGDMDDVKARVYNHAYDNYLLSYVEVCGALHFQKKDPAYAYGCLQAAREDFHFAQERFRTKGVEAVQPYEHTYSHGPAQYYAAAAMAAAGLWTACGEEEYRIWAEKWADCLLGCQAQDSKELGFGGFFFQDQEQKRLVHYNHQSREYQFMQAFDLLLEAFPNSENKEKWKEALERYGAYLKAISGNTRPYGMLPAGIYRKDEWKEKERFPYLHLLSDYETEKENFREQLELGTPVGEHYVIKNFPVWFSFRGNTAVLLSMGKAAAIVGRRLKDETLLQMGREQIYWMLGKNPFDQSLMYGVGERYPSQYAVFPGESAGELPVGIETRGNEDIPYWPQGNNATYREVWTSCTARWLWLTAELLRAQ